MVEAPSEAASSAGAVMATFALEAISTSESPFTRPTTSATCELLSSAVLALEARSTRSLSLECTSRLLPAARVPETVTLALLSAKPTTTPAAGILPLSGERRSKTLKVDVLVPTLR